MTKSLVVVAGCLLVASAAWAGPPPSPQGSGNNVSSALAPAAPAPAPDTTIRPAGPPPSPQGSGNNVGAALKTTPAPAPAPSNVNASGTGPSNAMQAPAFNPMAYGSTTDCLNAAAAANQPLSQCKSMAAR